jgi:DNA polymerase sigma
LDSLSPIKEHIIETIKSQIKECFLNDNLSYQLDIYGSFKSHLDIVCSDIDMVFIPQKAKNIDICDLILQLSNHFSSLNKYYKVTPIYTASIPLIKLMIKYDIYLEENKSLLDNYSKLINSSIYKNYPYNNEKEISYVNIDISFPVNNNNKKSKNAPFHQIEFIKNSLSTYLEASIVIRILKRALKLTDMNNSYKGGLSSYTIFLLVASYMKHINKNNINNKHKSNSYGHAFHDVVKYFSKFDFYLNIIDIDNKEGNIYMKRNKKYSSADYENIPIILDPVTGLNAGKSTFRINEVQNVFIALNEELEQLRNLYDKSNKAKENNNKDKENIDEENLIITLLKNVEKKYLNK